MTQETWLTGITTSGTPHLGNYVGAIRPTVEASSLSDRQGYFFLADYHALIKNQDRELLRRSRQEISASWLALGLDTDRAVFYRQSDVPEIMELTWILTCLTSKGLMNRAHAYKSVVQENLDSGANDADKAITMGLFCYPILMAADILMFRATHVPVGRDQTQHLEMARDIAQRFNHHYGEHMVLPQAVVEDDTALLSGLDGRKMSKSYNNTIPLFASGIGWGDAKQKLYELLEAHLAEPRERYEDLMANPSRIDDVLDAGALRAREHSRPYLNTLRDAVGV